MTAHPQPIAGRRRREPPNDWRSLLAHTALGVIAGMLLLHPVTKAIYADTWTGTASSGQRLALAFSAPMLGMTASFAALGGAVGFLFGLFNRIVARHRRVRGFLEAELERTVVSLVASGESEHVEFKASARWDLERGCVSRQLEDTLMRTVAGMLNNTGGSLLIGVNDEGGICGLERDYATLKDRNRDGFERFIVGLMRSRLGGHVCPLAHVTFHAADGRDICRIIVEPADRPVYFQDGGASRFYLRTGNSTRELDARETLEHVSRRFRARPADAFRMAVFCGTLFLGTLQACGHTTRSRAAQQPAPFSMADLRSAIAAQLWNAERPAWAPARHWPRVRRLYERFGHTPLWIGPLGATPRAVSLLRALEDAPSHALSTREYSVQLVGQIVNGAAITARSSAQQLADADVRLTAVYTSYASDMLIGQVDPRTISQAWHIPRDPSEIDSALAASLQSPELETSLAAMVPADSAYRALRSAYARYRAIADSGGWPKALQARLEIEGLLVRPTDVPRSNAAGAADIAAALKRFQALHGLDTTGAVGPATRRALNVTAADRAHQIGANMERIRWLPRTRGSRYVVVNIPSFRLHAHDSAGRVLEMKVAVGAAYDRRATPAFSDSMEYVVFRPYWNVPARIAQQEILSRASADTGFLNRLGYEWYADGRVRRLRQRPGPTNALGSVKFMFPNQFDVYLHDTPDKSVFDRADRAVSFGCIRLERPDLFAQFVLGWPLDSVRRSMQRPPDNRIVSLPRKLAVYIVYFTAFPRDGEIAFANDLYDRDSALDRELIDSTARRHP